MANSYSIDLEASSNQYLSITDAAQTGLDITGDMTIECWVRFETVSESWYPMVAKWDLNQYAYYLTLNTVLNELRLYTSANGTTLTNSGISWTPSTATWYHIAAVYDASAGSVEFYINGISMGGEATSSTSIANTTGQFVIGNEPNTSRYFDGLIDEVRVWNDIRTSTQIANNYNKQLVGNEAGLVAYYQFNNNANDLTSNNNDLTENNSPTYSTTVPFVEDRSLELASASSQYLSIADADQTGLDLTGDLTIEAWVNFSSLPGGTASRNIVSKWSQSSGQRSYLVGWNDSVDALQFATAAGGGSPTINQTWSWTPTLSTWYHIAIVMSSSTNTVDCYIDGVAQTQATGVNTTIFNSTTAFEIGRQSTAGNLFDGKIDEVRIWNTARTSTQINDNKSTYLTGNESGLVSYWQFNNNANDFTTNNNHLTENNSPTYSTDVPFTESDGTKINTLNIESIGLINGITIGDVAIKNGFRL